VFSHKRKSDTSITPRPFFNCDERQFGKKITTIYRYHSGQYISNTLNDLFLTRGVMHKLIPLSSPESNVIRKQFNQTINAMAPSMTIVTPDFPCLCVKSISTAPYSKNRHPDKYLLSSTTSFESFHRKKRTISPVNPFGSQCYVHIREDDHSS
jgi:hypothetical protein